MHPQQLSIGLLLRQRMHVWQHPELLRHRRFELQNVRRHNTPVFRGDVRSGGSLWRRHVLRF
jgi:hypothetical protein